MDKEEKNYESTFIPLCPLPSGPLFRGIGEEGLSVEHIVTPKTVL